MDMITEGLTPKMERIQGERFGAEGLFALSKFIIPIQTETVGKIDYTAHIIRRAENPQLGAELARGEKRQMIMLSGLDTSGQDWLRMASQLMTDMPDVEQLTLLDHPSTSGVRHERRDVAINTTSFENSAKVISTAMERLVEQGEMKTGQIAIGISTGSAVLEELVALNPKMIDIMVLCAPASMLDRTEEKMMKGGAHGGTEYLKQFFTDLLRRIPERHLKPKSERSPVAPVAVVKSIPEAAKGIIPADDLKKIRFQNFAFEGAFSIGRKFPRFWQHFTGMWGDSNPHVPIIQADYKKDLALVSKNTTEKAREQISGKKVVVVLGVDDQAVPPAEFLLEEDKRQLETIADQNEKSEKTIDTIISRVKGKFKNNVDTTVVLAVGGPDTHVGIKTNTEVYGPVIANILEPIVPKLSLSGDSLKQWFGKSN